MIAQSPDTDLKAPIQAAFRQLREHAAAMTLTTAAERIERLKRIKAWVEAHRTDIHAAMYADFRKPSAEVDLGELTGLMGDLRYTIRHLKQWMKPQRVPTPLSMVGTSGYLQYEPKGVVLIISPWNYPFDLMVGPLIAALAAGNVCMLKPSELTPNTAALLKRMVSDLFPPEEVVLFEGAADTAQAMLDLPFNHIFFTGSPALGKVVMAAAAKHLASVTLELGGKSPFVVDETANIKKTAEILAWAKYFNNGQTCIAPDYLLVHEAVKTPLLNEIKAVVDRMYGTDAAARAASDSYARIVNQRHFQRVKGLIDDAARKGATVLMGGRTNEADNYVEPTMIDGVTDEMQVMQEEIFGPVLPVVSVKNLDEALDHINSREKPLALYIHSNKQANIDYLINRTSAGDTVINDAMIHFTHSELPFGGVNNSGLGSYHGYFGFQELSHRRGILRRQFGTMNFLFPPYTDRVKKFISWAVKFS
ncbi:aldehyde dehydrogenase family protein [uncultured Fibrella sp.]|uniref:aldehyde dehydrogenase family protein n=1 Tax=uncultured Fibrella sp. TaxID=1284596 RepID=UPI0035CA6290